MYEYKRGVWGECDDFPCDQGKDFDKQIESLGFKSRTRIGFEYNLNLVYWCRFLQKEKRNDYLIEFNNGDFSELIYLPDMPSFIMILKELKPLIDLDNGSKAFETYSTSDFSMLENVLDNRFNLCKKVHYSTTAGGPEGYDMHYLIGEF